MRALILAAGYGKRLGKLTEKRPKPMVNIARKPVLEHIIFWLSKYGIHDIIINTGYQGGVIHNYFGTRCLYFHDPQLDYTQEETIDQVKNWFSDDYMLVQNGDTLTDLDINALMKANPHRSIRFMDWKDKNKYAGTQILTPTYLFGGINDMVECAVNTSWVDMGTLQGLKEARRIYGR